MIYRFNIDEKYTMWERHSYSIEAGSYEEALKIVEKEFEDPEFRQPGIYDGTIPLLDTTEYLTVEDNQGCPTKELMYNQETIKTN
ncbi:MAG: hypothetical protein EOL97_16255 [Spirochaetia bacterium]|nr:hypothetical protein [Spirochaetia bacterium]